jgi:hypothetical protein
MKTQKMSLANMQGKLSRAEMKLILGGSDCSATCPKGSSASITNCNGTCTGGDGYATCSGQTATLTKRCATVKA